MHQSPAPLAEATSRRKSSSRTNPNGVDFVVVANRLPLECTSGPEGDEWKPSPGGLVSALTAVLQKRNGLWIGWTGGSDRKTPPPTFEGMGLRAIEITPQEYEDFYLGFSNATLWPLYHDAIRAPTFHRSWWQAYQRINLRYATAVAESVAQGGTVWIHDYQLQLVPQMLRRLRPDVRIGFFLHIPFPPRELFMQLPWRREILTGLMGADLVGFQVPLAAANFSRMARRMLGATGTDAALQYDGREIRVGAFPISVDVAHISEMVKSPEIRARAKEIRQELGSPELVLLGVDRLDYTKGILQRTRALSELFADGVLTPGKDVMVQVAVPSRETDAHYERERHLLEQAVSQMNGDHGLLGSPAMHYLHQNMPFDELLALYLAADVMIVTPFRDGMNLVAKEYVMAHADLSGRLVLSEFAGAASELRGAFIVNPHDLDGLKEGIKSAVRVGTKEARSRMSRMRRKIASRDVYDWANAFLTALDQSSSSAAVASRDRSA